MPISMTGVPKSGLLIAHQYGPFKQTISYAWMAHNREDWT
jgi:hypothetical protein